MSERETSLTGRMKDGAQLYLPGLQPPARTARSRTKTRLYGLADPNKPRDLYPTFAAVHRELKPRTPLPKIEIRFYAFAHLSHTIRLREGKMLVRISDLLESAPETVLEALAQILMRKLYRKPAAARYVERYRRYINRREMAARIETIRRHRGRKRLSGPHGAAYDLEEIYTELNAAYFHGLLPQPRLSWGQVRSRHNLAHFDAAHNAILVSRIFDHPGMPRWVLAYVLYHEMLHIKHPIRHEGARRRIHPPEFQADERRFPRWREAEAFLKKL